MLFMLPMLPKGQWSKGRLKFSCLGRSDAGTHRSSAQGRILSGDVSGWYKKNQPEMVGELNLQRNRS